MEKNDKIQWNKTVIYKTGIHNIHLNDAILFLE